MYCPNCGKQINDNSKFCGFCGCNIASDIPQQPSYTPQEIPGRNPANVSVLFGILAVISAVLFFCFVFNTSFVHNVDMGNRSQIVENTQNAFTFGICDFVFSIIGIIFSIVSKVSGYSGIARKAGFFMCLLSLLLVAGFVLWMIMEITSIKNLSDYY